MKMIGKILRGYFCLVIFAGIFAGILDILSPESESKASKATLNYKKKTVTLRAGDGSRNGYEFEQIFKQDDVVVSVTCESTIPDSKFYDFTSLDSVTPQKHYELINRELNRRSGRFDKDICSDDSAVRTTSFYELQSLGLKLIDN